MVYERSQASDAEIFRSERFGFMQTAAANRDSGKPFKGLAADAAFVG
jgi:hypothetical protein